MASPVIGDATKTILQALDLTVPGACITAHPVHEHDRRTVTDLLGIERRTVCVDKGSRHPHRMPVRRSSCEDVQAASASAAACRFGCLKRMSAFTVRAYAR